ncbi:MAG: adenylosuccinate synthetase, partial [Chloroflexi bacterium]|nr:adenylosuccinate synthetase [Chloroflexota bacterium]
MLQKIYNAPTLDETAVSAEYAAYAQRLARIWSMAPCCWTIICVTSRSVLAEGAQGTFLDIDHGTYPFVTSSVA